MKENYSIIYSSEAVEDIKETYSYIAFELKENPSLLEIKLIA